jgi:acyl-CoA thioesterase
VVDSSLPAVQRLDALFRSDPTTDTLGARIVDWGPGSAVVECEVTAAHLNFVGVGHGGFLFTVGDIAMSFASNGYGRIALAIRIDISFMKGVSLGDLVRAEATTTHASRRLGHHRLLLTVDDALVAEATGTTFRTDEWHFGRESWPSDWPHR